MDDRTIVTQFHSSNNDIDDERVAEWEAGLPNLDDLTPLSQPLIPQDLATAFSISPEHYRTLGDVTRASHTTLSTIRRPTPAPPTHGPGYNNHHFKSFNNNYNNTSLLESNRLPADHPPPPVRMMLIDDDNDDDDDESRKLLPPTDEEAADSALRNNNSCDDHSGAARALKRPRLVWTPQLHKRFVEVVSHLGLNNAVPKTIMQMMNVEGLTRENVASHLQKYRLYLKRQCGGSIDGPALSDHLFASHDSNAAAAAAAANKNTAMHHYSQQQQQQQPMMPVPMMHMAEMHVANTPPPGMGAAAAAAYHVFDHHHHHHHQYSTMMQQHRD